MECQPGHEDEPQSRLCRGGEQGAEARSDPRELVRARAAFEGLLSVFSIAVVEYEVSGIARLRLPESLRPFFTTQANVCPLRTTDTVGVSREDLVRLFRWIIKIKWNQLEDSETLLRTILLPSILRFCLETIVEMRDGMAPPPSAGSSAQFQAELFSCATDVYRAAWNSGERAALYEFLEGALLASLSAAPTSRKGTPSPSLFSCQVRPGVRKCGRRYQNAGGTCRTDDQNHGCGRIAFFATAEGGLRIDSVLHQSRETPSLPSSRGRHRLSESDDASHPGDERVPSSGAKLRSK